MPSSATRATTRPSVSGGHNKNLHQAKSAKNDEFYTQLTDIEKELQHYTKHFRGKVVFCNCDDPRESNFWKFFSLNFERLGLKKLIGTHYVREGSSYKYEITRQEQSPSPTPLLENGDFRSPECVALLQEADIVVTNPPFSLFREYVAQLVEYGKRFLVIGNMNAITYKDVFGFIKSGDIWLGFTHPKIFIQPDGSEKSFGNINWFTNLDHKKRHEELYLVKRYDPDTYPKYDNYDAIEISKVAEIPMDYDGVMGVPITFLDKFNPEQFEILGIANSARWIGFECYTVISGKKIYNRIIIKRNSEKFS